MEYMTLVQATRLEALFVYDMEIYQLANPDKNLQLPNLAYYYGDHRKTLLSSMHTTQMIHQTENKGTT